MEPENETMSYGELEASYEEYDRELEAQDTSEV